jgi:hypothetical protein
MGLIQKVEARHVYKYEIDNNAASNTTTGTIKIFDIPANCVIKKVSALVDTVVEGYAAKAITSINTTTNVVTSTAHGFNQGLVVQASTTTTLPTGLEAATDYIVSWLSVNTFKLLNASTLAEIDISDAGTGTHTLTPTVLTYELGDGDDANGFLKTGFAGSTGYVGASIANAYVGEYQIDTSLPSEKYYAAADTMDFVITGVAKAGKVTFYIEYFLL